MVEGTGKPYGISRSVVEGAMRAGGTLNSPRNGRDDPDVRPMPAMSQVTATPAPSDSNNNTTDDDCKLKKKITC